MMGYVWFLLRHKWYVFWACLRLGVPLWTALAHDWDKLLAPHTMLAFKRRYDQGNDPFGMDADEAYHVAYHLHCVIRSKHHWQHWLSPRDSGRIRILPMSDVARREMLADWIGMGRTLGQPDVWRWYEGYRPRMTVHPDTLAWLDEQVERLKCG